MVDFVRVFTASDDELSVTTVRVMIFHTWSKMAVYVKMAAAPLYRSSTKLSQWKIGQAPSSRMGVCKSWFQHSLYLSSPPQWNKNFNKFWNQHDWKKWLGAEPIRNQVQAGLLSRG